jgi:adenine deaminase
MESKNIAQLTRHLVDVAMGRTSAEVVIRGGQWVCVQAGEIVSSTDIAISMGRIAYVGEDASHTIGDETTIVEAQDRFLVPGLLDGHMHVESGMITVTEFVRAVLPRGTTGVFIDPHEIANVFGLPGVRMMLDEAIMQPIHVWVQIPSCVPSATGLETPGAEIGPDEVVEGLKWPGVIGLGEMMNFPGVFQSEDKFHAEMAETVKAGKVIGGHYASLDLGIPFHGYVVGGPADDHEGTRVEDAVARVRQGMKVMMRLGSAWHDVATQIKAVTELGLDSRHFILVTDDSHSGTLVNEGHMDRVVKHAIAQGIEPITAIQMATLNTAEHFGVAHEIGQIAPGRYADILLVSDLDQMVIDQVFAKGEIAVENSQLQISMPSYTYPDKAFQSVNFARALEADDFLIRADDEKEVIVHVIGVIENQAPTRHLRLAMTPRSGELQPNVSRDIVKVAMVERHRGTGEIQLGFVQGFGIDAGTAIASTVAHDSHHLLVIGTDDRSMAYAVNELNRIGGGQIVVRDAETIALVELPIAGLMSNERAEIVAEKAEKLLQGFQSIGCKLNSANMQLSLLGLVVIPELRISDKGLVDVDRFEIIPLVDG